MSTPTLLKTYARQVIAASQSLALSGGRPHNVVFCLVLLITPFLHQETEESVGALSTLMDMCDKVSDAMGPVHALAGRV